MSLPVITLQPQSITVSTFDSSSTFLPPPNLIFSVAATSDQGGLRYQWFRNGQPLVNGINQGRTTFLVDFEDVTGPTLSLIAANFTAAGSYFCRIHNDAGSVDSNQVSLTFGTNFPTITLQPASVVATLGSAVSFATTATPYDSNTPVYYNWFRYTAGLTGWQRMPGGDTAAALGLPDGTASMLTIESITAADVGSYFCLVTSSAYDSLVQYGVSTNVVTLNLPTTTVTPATSDPIAAGGPVVVPPNGDPNLNPDGGNGGIFTILGIGADGTGSTAGWKGLARVVAAGNGGRTLRDGDFTNGKFIGPPLLEMPFGKFGDRQTVIWRQKVRGTVENFATLPAYTTHPDRPDLWLIHETTPEHMGAGVLYWERWYCAVPSTHYEPESFPYAYQYFVTANSLASFTRSVSSRIKCEFFLERDQASFPVLIKDEMDILPTTIINSSAQGGGVTLFKSGDNDLHITTGSPFFISNSDWIVGENSRIEPWYHPIMVRKTRYVPGPKPTDIGKVILSAVSGS